MDPGSVATAIYRDSKLFSSQPLKWLIQNLYAPPWDGAAAVVHAASAPSWGPPARPRGECENPGVHSLLCSTRGRVLYMLLFAAYQSLTCRERGRSTMPGWRGVVFLCRHKQDINERAACQKIAALSAMGDHTLLICLCQMSPKREGDIL